MMNHWSNIILIFFGIPCAEAWSPVSQTRVASLGLSKNWQISTTTVANIKERGAIPLCLSNKHGTKMFMTRDDDTKNNLEVGEMYSNPITAFLGKFLPGGESRNSDDDASSSGETFIDDWDKAKLTNLPINKMVTKLDAGLREREWFVTGNVMPELFADDFFFSDPDVQLRGIQKYGEGVRRLFDQETSRMGVISVVLDAAASEAAKGDVQVVLVEWRLSGKVNIGPVGLNIKPYIVTSDLHIRGGDGLIVFQEDRFDIPGWDILLSAVAPWLPFLAEPAPPVEDIISKRVTD